MKAVESRIGMECGQAATVARAHCLNQRRRFSTSDFADNEAIRAQAKCRSEQIVDVARSSSFVRGIPRFQSNDIRMIDDEFVGVLDDDDSLARR